MKHRIICACLAIAVFAPVAVHGGVGSRHDPTLLQSRFLAQSDRITGIEFTPENTVILANQTDAAFSRDFSPFLKGLRLHWTILQAAAIPDTLRDRNIILTGQPDSPFTAEIVLSLLAAEEAAAMAQNGQQLVIQKHSPWRADRAVLIAVGADPRLAKAALEDAVSSIIEGARDRTAWYLGPSGASEQEMREHILQFQYVPEGDELPRDALRIDLARRPVLWVSPAQAAEDVERLFYLLSWGWCGYGFFSARGDMAAAKADILAALRERPIWRPADLAQLIRRHLGFIHDCHLQIGGHACCQHLDFWYDSRHDLRMEGATYVFTADGVTYRVLSVNGGMPQDYVFPSLNARGDPVYRLGALAYAPPGPLVLTAEGKAGRREIIVKLTRSDPKVFRGALVKFGEERIGGVPVLRARSFADIYSSELERFLQAAGTYRGEPYLIIDIRGNSGGNTDWPKRWITGFTGRQPSMKQVLTELTTKTSMMGRANLFSQMLASYPERAASWIRGEIDRFDAQAALFESHAMSPHWTPLEFPGTALIPNETTLVVVFDSGTSSAGEGLITFLYRQVENVVLVGENSCGALTFGQVSSHRLPHSRLSVTLPIKLNLQLDLEFREERGFTPDLWVPAGDAVNYAVAAIRSGTITTRKAVPGGGYEGPFVPEKPPVTRERRLSLLAAFEMIAGIALACVYAKVRAWRKALPKYCFVVAGAAHIGGLALIQRGLHVGYAAVVYGVVFLALGLHKRRPARALQLAKREASHV